MEKGEGWGGVPLWVGGRFDTWTSAFGSPACWGSQDMLLDEVTKAPGNFGSMGTKGKYEVMAERTVVV